METHHILIVEDEALVAAMIREALSGTKFRVTAVAFDADAAYQYLDRQPVDAALLDINLNGKMAGINIGRHIRDHHHIPFLYLTAHADEQTLHQAKVTQPAGYIVKPFTERDIRAGLEIALYNFHQQQTAEPELERIHQRLAEPLSSREMDVLRHIFDGRSNQEMADALFLSINTVKSHISRLFDKLDVSSRTEAIARVRDLLK